jgi:hypothetical protein
MFTEAIVITANFGNIRSLWWLTGCYETFNKISVYLLTKIFYQIRQWLIVLFSTKLNFHDPGIRYRVTDRKNPQNLIISKISTFTVSLLVVWRVSLAVLLWPVHTSCRRCRWRSLKHWNWWRNKDLR